MVPAMSEVAPPENAGSIPDLVELVHHVMKGALRHVQPTLNSEEISMGQFWALHTVSSLDSASLGTVARTLNLSPPTVCANIDALEESGLVRRHRSEKDRRSIEISLTPRGRRVEARVWREVSAVISGAARGVPGSDLATSIRTFRTIADRLDQGPVPRRAGA